MLLHLAAALAVELVVEPNPRERLEWAHGNRGALAPYAARAADDLARLTWDRAAGEFLDLLRG